MTYDIIIVGGGIAGLTLACALGKQTSLSIAILEAKTPGEDWSYAQHHPRVSAIALSSQRIFQSLGVWGAIKNKRISPFTQIEVWEAGLKSSINFDCKEIGESVLGFIIENNLIQTALKEKLNHHPQISLISPVQLVALKESENTISLIANDGKCFTTKLAIAADGAQSWLRQTIGIKIDEYDYEQEAIVATVITEQSHEQIARQCFLEKGPLAFLPLSGPNTSSIVWSVPIEKAKQLKALDAKMFCDELASAFEHRLGKVLEIGERYCFPLRSQQAQQYVKSSVVLIGDAAHTVHPLAGQGANIGLLDAASLAELIIDSINHRRDFASHLSLRRYERWRKADNFLMLTGINMIKKLFENDKLVVSKLRKMGLDMTNQFQWIKNFFTRHAVGDRPGLPQLAQSRNFD